MRREYLYEEFTATVGGTVAEIEAALQQAFVDSFDVDAIRMHPLAMVSLARAVSAGVSSYVFISARPETLPGGFLVDHYRSKFTGKSLPIVLDESYPKNWFALECEHPLTGTEVPSLLIGSTRRKIKLGS